jgi:hypothetical protein
MLPCGHIHRENIFSLPIYQPLVGGRLRPRRKREKQRGEEENRKEIKKKKIHK